MKSSNFVTLKGGGFSHQVWHGSQCLVAIAGGSWTLSIANYQLPIAWNKSSIVNWQSAITIEQRSLADTLLFS
jgi:hypothetical protein